MRARTARHTNNTAAAVAVAVAAPASIYKSMDYNGAWKAASLQDLV
jgi:hypothetical protein